jgi:RNA polymerase sigma-70 factor, ECF subfamily
MESYDADAEVDRRLMARARWSDEDAFGKLVDLHWERTLRYAWHMTADRDRAYDIAQEVFARLWASRRDWEPTGSLPGWLLRTARNLVLSERRKRDVRARWRLLARGEAESSPRTPLQNAENGELRGAIAQAVEALSPRRREVFVLFHVQHLSYREIGEILDLSTRTIANHLRAAVGDLRTALRPFASGRDAPGDTEDDTGGDPPGKLP